MNALDMVALGEVENDVMETLKEYLVEEFGFEIRILSPLPDPAYAYGIQRDQYSSTAILTELLKHIPPDAERILGITKRDLFIPMLSFVFGHAQFNGKAAVVSLARLQQEFYGLGEQRLLFLQRAVKEAIHEIGHTLGLTHCPDLKCVMSLSNTIRQVDVKQWNLCRSCSIMLQETLPAVNRRTSN